MCRRALCSTRRLCKPQAISMIASDSPSAVFRNWSLAMRLILIPAIACSTRPRTRASFRLWRFSPGFSSRCCGFFSAANSAQRAVDSLGSPDHCAACSSWGNGSLPPRQSSCHGESRVWSGLESAPVCFWCLPPLRSCRKALFSSRSNAGPVFSGFSAVADGVPPHPQ